MDFSRARSRTRNRQFYENMSSGIFDSAIVNDTPKGEKVTSNGGISSQDSVNALKHAISQLSTQSPMDSKLVENKEKVNTTIPTATTTTTLPTTATTGSRPVIEVFDGVWKSLRDFVGINRPSCQNGGRPAGDGKCSCPTMFEGTTCERRVCLNGGQWTKTNAGPVTFECKCPHPQYIDGMHCESVRCANQAPLIRGPNGTWHCDCSNRLYNGQFCENFSAPYAALFVPLIILAIFLVCCYVCRLDWCPRGHRNHRHSSSARQGDRQRTRRRVAGTNTERDRIPPRRLNSAQEFLLSTDQAGAQTTVFPSSNGPPYIIRLDTIPTFNPNMIGGVEPSGNAKPMEPPPSYDQAMSAPPVPDPPRYTERAEEQGSQPRASLPPPPSRNLPDPPS